MATLSASVRIPVAALRPVHISPAADGQALLDLVDSADDVLLSQLITLFSQRLQQRAAALSNEQVSQHLRFIAQLQERREVAELAANPARRAGVGRAAQTYASKA